MDLPLSEVTFLLPAVTVLNPGKFVREVRYLLGRMS